MGCEKKGAEWETISTTPKVQNNEASRYLFFFNETVSQGLQNSYLKTSWRTGIKLFVSSQRSLVDLVKLLSLKVRFWLKKNEIVSRRLSQCYMISKDKNFIETGDLQVLSWHFLKIKPFAFHHFRPRKEWNIYLP